MPFPYMYPIGALIAATLLGVTITVFAVVLRALDRTVTRVADGICSGLVSGFRAWSDHQQEESSDRSPRATGSDDSPSPVRVQPVHRT